VNPVRMRKLSQSTYIEPLRLREAGYRFDYTLEQAMVDWKQDAPEDFAGAERAVLQASRKVSQKS
ncbi:MAG: hypothetical protein WB950_09875, partial [Acidobacteriaceae bacterium]